MECKGVAESILPEGWVRIDSNHPYDNSANENHRLAVEGALIDARHGRPVEPEPLERQMRRAEVGGRAAAGSAKKWANRRLSPARVEKRRAAPDSGRFWP